MVRKIPTLLFAFLFIFCIKGALAQITISPIMLFLDEENRFGTVMVMNGSDQVQEISIEFPFGYPVTDEQGQTQMIYDDSTTAEEWGISDVIRGFPQNFTLQPGERQVVRLTIQPKDFKEGMYWSRIKTTSTPESQPIGETEDDEITTQINYKFEQITTVFYKHGDLNTGLEVENIAAEQGSETVEIITDVSRTGNAPFLGSIDLTVRDQQGNTIAERSSSTSIYFDYREIFELNNSELSPGEYEAEVAFIAQRNDVPRSDLVQIDPIKESINFTVE